MTIHDIINVLQDGKDHAVFKIGAAVKSVPLLSENFEKMMKDFSDNLVGVYNNKPLEITEWLIADLA